MVGKHTYGSVGVVALGGLWLALGCDVQTSGSMKSLFGGSAPPPLTESAVVVTAPSDAGVTGGQDADAGAFDGSATNGFVDSGVSQSDPCAAGASACDPHATCTNVGEAASCACDTNYTGDGYTCAPVDACQINHGNCGPLADCTPTGAGTNRCDCSAGYSGNGLDCVPE